MAYMEPNPAISQAVELVIKNFGLTGARDIRLIVAPELKRAGGQGLPEEVVKLPTAIPFLAPGQEIRTLWDVQARRIASELPKRYDVTVSYTDFFDKPQTTHSVLDWEVLEPLKTLVVKNAHHAAGALESIENLLRDWMRGRSMPKLAAYNGRSLDAMRQAELQEFEAAARAAEAREREQGESQGNG
jgi:hypothetical protein